MINMRDRIITVIILFLIAIAGPAFSQGPAQKAVTPAVPETAEGAPRPAEKVVNVEISDGLLSIELVDADFGDVMKAIAEQSGIKVTMSGDVQSRKLNTRFRGIELERGIVRIMTLINEKNYTLKYDTTGKVEMIEIYAIAAPAPAPGKSTGRPDASKARTPAPAATVRPPAPAAAPATPSRPPAPSAAPATPARAPEPAAASQPSAPPKSSAPPAAPRSAPAFVPREGPAFVPKGAPTGIQKNPPIQRRLLTPAAPKQEEIMDSQPDTSKKIETEENEETDEQQ
ncbi:MAG: hypothetical protein HZB33_08460 [Nitrospirae bacterium]|nr:hypothetical protein [Nitrospirota bacterium]